MISAVSHIASPVVTIPALSASLFVNKFKKNSGISTVPQYLLVTPDDYSGEDHIFNEGRASNL